MRIGIIIEKYPLPPTKGGAIQTLVSHYLEENEKTHIHDFFVYSCYDMDAEACSKRYKYTKFYYVKTDSLKYNFSVIISYICNHFFKMSIGNGFARTIGKMMSTQEFDQIIVEGNPRLIQGLKKYNDCGYILHLHNDYLNRDNPNSSKLINSYNYIFTISGFLKKRIEEVEPEYKDVFTLNNGIDLSPFYTIDNIIIINRKKLYNIDNKKVTIIFSGRIVPEKGCLELINAFKGSDYLLNNANLVIAGGVIYGENGKSDYLKRVQEAIKNINSIIMTGYIPYQEMPCLYMMSDIGIIPTMCEEAFGLCAIENMAAGNALIVSDSGALPDLLENQSGEKCGIVVARDYNYVENLKKSMEYLVNNEIVRKKMGNLGKQMVENYSKQNYCSKFFELLDMIKLTE